MAQKQDREREEIKDACSMTTKEAGSGAMNEAYQSPQSVMSRTSCCCVNLSVRLQCGLAGKAAEGMPHCEMSMEDVALAPDMLAGMLARWSV